MSGPADRHHRGSFSSETLGGPPSVGENKGVTDSREQGAARLTAALLLTLALFVGGGFAGWGLARWRAPDSELAGIVGLFPLPVAFAASLAAWQGLTLLLLLLRVWRRGTAVGRSVRSEEASGELRRRATVMFPIAPLVCAPCGLAVGLVAGGEVLATTAIFAVAGAAYGATLVALGRKNLLPIVGG